MSAPLHRLDAWFYRGGHPNRPARLLNGLWSRLASRGRAPQRLYTLELSGRRTGRPVSIPVVVAEHDGGRYLVSMLGEDAYWVANVRAADGRAALRRGGREDVRLEEVAAHLRAPVLRHYLQVAPGARAHIPVDPSAPLQAFEHIAAKYPVFRVHPR